MTDTSDTDALLAELMREQQLIDLLKSFDDWLGNSDGLMIEDVIEWRDQLAAALGRPKY